MKQLPLVPNQTHRHSLRGAAHLLLLACSVCFTAAVHAEDSWLDKLDESLHLETHDGFFRTDLSILGDIELYYIDERPPGLIFAEPGDEWLFSPRASLFLDTQIGPHLYSLVQGRIDRGFDPGSRNREARLDEYLLRYTPFDDSRLNLQIGKFATFVGNWVLRHDSWQNPFITAPLPYENVTVITDQNVPPTPEAFLARRDVPDVKAAWLPVVWGPSYASGAAVFGSLEKFDYAFEIKNASLSSRPGYWDAKDLGWRNPTASGRLGYRPSAPWNLGVSASGGTYLAPAAESGSSIYGPAPGTLRSGRKLGDYQQLTLAHDLSYARRHLQIWGEVFFSRFEVPNVGDADTLAYYIEAKYKLTPQLFAALRWNQQVFGTVRNSMGRDRAWDRDIWRIDSALGYRFTRHLQAKIQYSYAHQKGSFQQGEQLIASQFTVKF